MTSTAAQVRNYRGPTILSFGFRPFFFGGAVWGVITIALWMPMLSGRLEFPTAFSPLEWHVHELLYGYVPAVVAGFLLTAIPNWTGQLPVVGTRLLVLFLIWLCGRAVVFASLWAGSPIAAAIDLSFLAYLGIVVAREIVAGSNTRNLKILVAILLLLVGNTVFHFEVILNIGTTYGTRIGIATTIVLIMIIGGRIIPSFTRNWLVRQTPGRLPQPFNQMDLAIMLISGIALIFWIVQPERIFTAAIATLAGLLNFVRLGRWAGHRTGGEPLVLVLHVAYGFVPLGYLLVALSIWRPDIITPAGALHAWTAGAIGLMTLAVMTRASLGHTGQELAANWSTTAIYICAAIAALARIAAGFDVYREPLLHVSATAWVLAFGGFAIAFGPSLVSSRK